MYFEEPQKDFVCVQYEKFLIYDEELFTKSKDENDKCW